MHPLQGLIIILSDSLNHMNWSGEPTSTGSKQLKVLGTIFFERTRHRRGHASGLLLQVIIRIYGISPKIQKIWRIKLVHQSYCSLCLMRVFVVTPPILTIGNPPAWPKDTKADPAIWMFFLPLEAQEDKRWTHWELFFATFCSPMQSTWATKKNLLLFVILVG